MTLNKNNCKFPHVDFKNELFRYRTGNACPILVLPQYAEPALQPGFHLRRHLHKAALRELSCPDLGMEVSCPAVLSSGCLELLGNAVSAPPPHLLNQNLHSIKSPWGCTYINKSERHWAKCF